MLPLLIRLSLDFLHHDKLKRRHGAPCHQPDHCPPCRSQRHCSIHHRAVNSDHASTCAHLHLPRCPLSDSTLPRTGRSSKDKTPRALLGDLAAALPGLCFSSLLSSLSYIHQISHEVTACAAYTCTSPPPHSPALCVLPRAQLCHPGATTAVQVQSRICTYFHHFPDRVES